MKKFVDMSRVGLSALRVCVRHPSLIPTATCTAWRLRRNNWWKFPPFLPVPSARYIEFRLHTAYGNDDFSPKEEDIHAYLDWCRRYAQYAR